MLPLRDGIKELIELRLENKELRRENSRLKAQVEFLTKKLNSIELEKGAGS